MQSSASTELRLQHSQLVNIFLFVSKRQNVYLLCFKLTAAESDSNIAGADFPNVPFFVATGKESVERSNRS